MILILLKAQFANPNGKTLNPYSGTVMAILTHCLARGMGTAPAAAFPKFHRKNSHRMSSLTLRHLPDTSDMFHVSYRSKALAIRARSFQSW